MREELEERGGKAGIPCLGEGAEPMLLQVSLRC